MAISQDYIAELTSRVDITELVKESVELKRAGRMEKGLCPFHNEKSPSFYVYPETNSYYCFGCGSGGDAITFVKNLHNLDYVEAVKYLAAKVGMPLPDEDDTVGKLRTRVLAINRETARFFVAALNGEEGRDARVYLRSRHLSDNTIRKFGLGYAPDSFHALQNHLSGLGFTQEEMLQANVIRRANNSSNVFDSFRGRVMFPIIDLRGNVIAFGGRRMGEDGGPKYLNSADTPVFKKSRGLFALNLAKKSTSKRYILAEGYMDVISLHQAGFTTAIATLGTALTAEQAKLISDYATEVVICYDSDEAGQKATQRAISILKNTPLKITVLSMEGAKDPDEFIAKFGADKFEQLLSGSRNTIEYELTKEKRKYDLTTADGRSSYIKGAVLVLAREASPTECDIYSGRIAAEAEVEVPSVKKELQFAQNRLQNQRRKAREQRQKEEGAAASINIPYGSTGNPTLKAAFAEQQLMAAILRNPRDVIPLVRQQITPAQLINPDIQDAYIQILKLADRGEQVELASLGHYLGNSSMALLSKIVAQNYEITFTAEDVHMFMERMQEATTSPKQAADMAPDDLQAYFAKMREKKS